jgi:hypothetical protein
MARLGKYDFDLVEFDLRNQIRQIRRFEIVRLESPIGATVLI